MSDLDELLVELSPLIMEVEIPEPSVVNVEIEESSNFSVDISLVPLEVEFYSRQILDVEIASTIIQIDLTEVLVEIEGEVFEEFLLLGESIDAFSAVCLIDGKIYKASSDISLDRFHPLGILMESGEVGEKRNVKTQGAIANQGWNWEVSNNKKIFLNENGVISQNITGNVLVEIGYPLSINSMLINIEEPILL